MRGLLHNQRPFWLCRYEGVKELVDDDGYSTGEFAVSFSEAEEYRANISPATGYAQTEMFGNLEDYDKVISPLPVDFAISENDVLFIDKEPEYGADGLPLYDYRVRRIARSLNHTSVAVQKVTVS